MPPSPDNYPDPHGFPSLSLSSTSGNSPVIKSVTLTCPSAQSPISAEPNSPSVKLSLKPSLPDAHVPSVGTLLIEGPLCKWLAEASEILVPGHRGDGGWGQT